jgi:hypothetical protein
LTDILGAGNEEYVVYIPCYFPGPP